MENELRTSSLFLCYFNYMQTTNMIIINELEN